MLTDPSRLPLAILPAMASRKVDLPAPLGPRIAVTWPRRACPDMSLSRFLNSRPWPGKLVTFSPAGTGPACFCRASGASRRLSRLFFLSVRRGGNSAARRVSASPALSVRWAGISAARRVAISAALSVRRGGNSAALLVSASPALSVRWAGISEALRWAVSPALSVR